MRPGNSSGSYEENWLCDKTNFSNRIGNFTSTEPTMFWILKSLNFAGKPSFWITRAYFRAANRECCSDLAPKMHLRHLYHGDQWNNTCADHFSRGENQSGRSRFPNSHNNRGKSLWIVFCISCMHCNLFQIKFSAIQINCCNNILQLGWVNAQIFCTSWLFWVLLLVRSKKFRFRRLDTSAIWWQSR